jgi:hypothetical protein
MWLQLIYFESSSIEDISHLLLSHFFNASAEQPPASGKVLAPLAPLCVGQRAESPLTPKDCLVHQLRLKIFVPGNTKSKTQVSVEMPLEPVEHHVEIGWAGSFSGRRFERNSRSGTSCLVNQQSAMGVHLLCVAAVAVGGRMTATKQRICNNVFLLN